MSYWDHVRVLAKSAWVFFAVFVGIGTVIDLVVRDRAVEWDIRLINGLFTTVLYVLLLAWWQYRKAP